MRFIDILTKIANKETLPVKIGIKALNEIFELNNENRYLDKDGYGIDDYIITDILDSEVDTFEPQEEFKIEKIHYINNTSGASDLVALGNMQWENNQRFFRKINELIDEVNKLKER